MELYTGSRVYRIFAVCTGYLQCVQDICSVYRTSTWKQWYMNSTQVNNDVHRNCGQETIYEGKYHLHRQIV
jgi:hypothetical protein